MKKRFLNRVALIGVFLFAAACDPQTYYRGGVTAPATTTQKISLTYVSAYQPRLVYDIFPSDKAFNTFTVSNPHVGTQVYTDFKIDASDADTYRLLVSLFSGNHVISEYTGKDGIRMTVTRSDNQKTNYFVSTDTDLTALWTFISQKIVAQGCTVGC